MRPVVHAPHIGGRDSHNSYYAQISGKSARTACGRYLNPRKYVVLDVDDDPKLATCRSCKVSRWWPW